MNNLAKQQELNQALELVKSKQQDDLRIDFDRAYKEIQQKNKPIEIIFQGKTFHVPQSMTTKVELYLQDCMVDGVIPDDKMMGLIERIFGQEFIDTMREADVESSAVSQQIIAPILSRWWNRKVKHVDEKKL